MKKRNDRRGPSPPAPLVPTEAELLAAACALQGVEPGSLLDFKVYSDRVVIILADYRKVTYHYADLVGFFSKSEPPTNTLKQ